MIGAEVSAAAREGLAWLVTYVLHGAIAGGSAAVLVRVARLAPAAEHRLWKMALFLPLVTASLAAFVALLAARAPGGTALAEAPLVFRVPGAPPAVTAAIAPSYVDTAISAAAFIVLLGIAAGAARFAIGLARVRKRLGDRRASVDPRLAASLARVAGRFDLGPIALIESADLDSPIALGARAIGVPSGDFASLADTEIDAVLAHELAHLERRDPLWFFLAGLVEATLWMPPYTRWIAARFRRSAELACDDRAVAATGDALGLGQALSRFAHAAFDAAHAALPGAARAPGVLVERVRRLAGAAAVPPAAPPRRLVSRSSVAVALLALVAIGSAGLTVSFARASGPPLALAPSVTAPPSADDVAATSGRVAVLVEEEIRLEAEIDAASVSPGPGRANDAVAARVVVLERDLRHAREERAWLERSFTAR